METYYFTFCFGQPQAGCFVKLTGTYNEARSKMFLLYGDKWGFQYDEAGWVDSNGISQEQKFHLTELV